MCLFYFLCLWFITRNLEIFRQDPRSVPSSFKVCRYGSMVILFIRKSLLLRVSLLYIDISKNLISDELTIYA